MSTSTSHETDRPPLATTHAKPDSAPLRHTAQEPLAPARDDAPPAAHEGDLAYHSPHASTSATSDPHAEAEFEVDRERYPRSALMADVRRLSTVSDWRSAANIAFQWLVVGLASWAAVASGHWAVYVLAGIVICSRQQAMGVMVHDATHYHLFNNRAVNDIVSDLFLAFPIGISTTLYRDYHYKHHRYTNSDRDPDWSWMMHEPDWKWPKTRWECFWLTVRSLFGVNIAKTAKVYLMYSPSAKLFTPISAAYPLRARILFVITTPIVFYFLLSTGAWLPAILLWTLPSMTVLNVTSRIRATAEHVLLPNTHQLNSTRTVIPNWLERVFICPFGINYHIEHHLFPSVPGYKLGSLHERLMRDENFRSRAHITRGYFSPRHGLLGELLTPAPVDDATPAAPTAS